MLSTAGPRITTNIAGKMKSAVGTSIFTGAFIARSSAATCRRLRDSSAWIRSIRPSGLPSCSAWMSELTTDVSSGMSTRSAILRSAVAAALADPELAEHEEELLDERALEVLAEPRQRGVEAETGLDADREDVERVRQLAPHLLAALPRPPS